MKKTFLTIPVCLLLLNAQGQQQQGRVLYERTMQLQLRMQGMGDETERMLPRSRKDKLEVLFSNQQSICRAVAEEAPEEFSSDQGGMRIHMVAAGASDETYTNFATGQVVEQREFGARNYIITDSISRLNWKLTGESITLLGYPCQKAVAQRIGKRMVNGMENGQVKSREMPDTANITAWFTPSIPVPAGPAYQGQLPGLILGIDINDGTTVYRALEISGETDQKAIKAPSKGKKVTGEEFARERDKMMKEMHRNGPARGGMIRMN